MKTKYLLGALALTMSTAAFAQEPAPTPEAECCCCKDGEHGEMACCQDSAGQAEGSHAEHGQAGGTHH